MIDKILYTAEATNIGARTGSVRSSDGVLDLQVRHPQALGGPPDGKYTNPEQLFAATYAACYAGALNVVGKGKNLQDGQVSVRVHLGNDPDGGFGLAAEILVKLPNIPQQETQELMQQAHQVCPYSKATRGNMEVTLTVVS